MKAKKIIMHAVLFIMSLGLQAQKNISGKTTYYQKPLTSVTIIVLKEGSSYLTGSQTDLDGSYTIQNIKKGNYKLLFSLIGYDWNRQVNWINRQIQILKMNFREKWEKKWEKISKSRICSLISAMTSQINLYFIQASNTCQLLLTMVHCIIHCSQANGLRMKN
ncbi:carboxypeptidase-like regulatory domain-containing protein [Flavobacterium aestivum]|uniref:carboxypeptidase-like regulatory domain-containing protein n=1 Tax=Flavobacterium aestivum TaxID=3003257 RepID=UPI002482681B|nr:carboxypeptidase-like regulatory domain-containing protein [Flavobacterium aestivum]